MGRTFDFWGYATKNDLLCSDGRTIRKDAFNDPEMVIGHAVLKNAEDGVLAYGVFNDTDKGRACKKIIENRDIKGLSIYANALKQRAGDVLHGVIREVSLVLAGANPGALIDFSMAHGDGGEDELYYYLLGERYTELNHSDIAWDDAWDDELEEDELEHADDGDGKSDDSDDSDDDDGETIEEVFNTLNDKQRIAVNAVIAAVADEVSKSKATKDDDDDDKDEDDMKQNVFDTDTRTTNFLSHSEENAILRRCANNRGSFKHTFADYIESNSLQHDAVSSGFTQDTSADGNVTWLFPEYKDLRSGAPELITPDQGWIDVVMKGVSKSPISRIRTSYVDIRDVEGINLKEDLRARGYQKGKQKLLTGTYSLVRRETDPQTVYVRAALHRDDIIDITDFDYVRYQYNIDRLALNEELAIAFMLGDGREPGVDKIYPEHIRPIWTDDELYTIHRDLDLDAAVRNGSVHALHRKDEGTVCPEDSG